MATPAAAPTLSERTDVHKSCKSLEGILNVLNEYCEAVGAVVALQKKLAKALRETASLKTTGEIAANAMNGSAIVFEALLEIDTKYTKLADKEFDNISTEVKKWFKKLVKEEKAHDQKLEKANTRIKLAGQTYEKKSKKNAPDVAEEHARYIDLISTLGPEISQEKYNHALNVTQRHNTTTNSVASCLARIADAEWLKACEGVRLIAPTVGTLTQWRVLCEGGWSEAMPQGLPNVQDNNPPTDPQPEYAPTATASPAFSPPRSPLPEVPATPERQRTLLSVNEVSPIQRRQPSPHISPHISPNVSSQNLAMSNSPLEQSRENLLPPGAFDTLKPPFFDPTTGSVRTLSAFPAPPSHIPTAPVRQQTQLSSHPSVSNTSSTIQQLTESPLSMSQESLPYGKKSSEPLSSYEHPPPPEHVPQTKDPSLEQMHQSYRPSEERTFSTLPTPQVELRRPQPIRTPTSSRSIPHEVTVLEEPSDDHSPQNERRRSQPLQTRDGPRDHDTEFGVQETPSKAHTYEGLRSKGFERNDSITSNGSLVAAMRDRYSSNPGSISPPPRELPRIPLSVNDLAARYQAPESPPVARPRAASPPVARQLSFPLDHQNRPRLDTHTTPYYEKMSHRPGSNSISTSTPTIGEDVRRRRQRAGDYTESDLRERERELQEREREIEARTRELERDRAQLRTVPEGSDTIFGGGNDEENTSARPPISPLRPRRISLRKQLQRPLSQMELEEPEPPRQRSQISSNHAPSPGGNHGRYIGPAPAKSANGDDYGDHRYSEDSSTSTALAHAPYCGCHSCSASKYGASSSSGEQEPRPVGGNALRPPSSPDKPKSGWMRRLSMPGMMSSAFSSDSKRNSANYSLGSGVSSTSLVSGQKKGLLSFDGRKNSSATNLRAPVHEDGRLGNRRSFDGRP